MENRAHAIAAGLFVILLGFATAMFVWWLGQRKPDVNIYLLECRENVTGLNTHAQVRYRGIRAGRVESIDLDPADRGVILVRISLDARFPLTAGTTARLNSQGVTGLAYVQLEDNGRDPRPLVDKDGEPPRLALRPTLVDTLGAQAGDIVAQASQLTTRLTQLLDDRNLRNLSRSLENLAAVSENLRDGLKDLPAVSASLREAFSEANTRRLATMLANLESASGQAAGLTQETRDMVRNLSALATRLDKLGQEAGGEFATTTLPRANALLQEISGSARRLSRLIDGLEREPQALIFGPRATPPGPGEPGFVAPDK